MSPATPSRIVCIGGAAIDRTYRLAAPVRLGTSNPSSGAVSFGGVARNVAETLARLGDAVALVSLVGDDTAGADLLAALAASGVDAAGVERADGSATAEYAAVIEPDGTLVAGLAAMDLFARLDAGFVARALPRLADARLVFAEANVAADGLSALVEAARDASWRLALDAVSVAKSARLPQDLRGVAVLFCALDEAQALTGASGPPEDLARALRARGGAAAVVTLGAEGLVVADEARVVRMAALPATVVDVTGAGDALVAGTVHRLARGAPLAEALLTGRALARLAVSSPGAVRADLDPALLAGVQGHDHA